MNTATNVVNPPSIIGRNRFSPEYIRIKDDENKPADMDKFITIKFIGNTLALISCDIESI
mgnify:CR=1 FL=1